MVITFLALVFAHLLADYPLQGDYLATTKGKNIISLVSHAGIWTGVICVTTYLLGASVNLLDITWLFIIHAIQDYMKAKPLIFYKKLAPSKGGLLIDQLVHIGQILILISYKF